MNKIPQFRTIICQYLLLASIIFSVIALLFFFFTEIKILPLVLLFFVLLHIIFFISIRSYDWIRIAKAKDNLVYMYLYEIMMVVLVLAVLFWHEGNMALSLYFFLVPLGALTLIDSGRAVLFSVLSGLFFGAVFLIETFLPDDMHYINITPQLNVALNITILSSIYFLVFFFLFWHNKLIQYRQQEHFFSELAITDNEIVLPQTANEQEIFDSLYEQIIACFEEAKPYCHPDFSIVELAKMLNSNTTYIYRTLKTKEHCNFNTFVNTYRINYVKNLLNEGEESQYTMAHIYTSAGFRHQSTFNLAFKNITGMTPSEYIKIKQRSVK